MRRGNIYYFCFPAFITEESPEKKSGRESREPTPDTICAPQEWGGTILIETENPEEKSEMIF